MWSNYPNVDYIEPLHKYQNKYERQVWEHLEEIWGKTGISRPTLRSKEDKDVRICNSIKR